MFIADGIQNIISAGTQQLILWISQVLPQVFLFLILLNAITRMIGQARVERLALRCGSNPFLRYLVLPFLSAIVLGNPMAVSMGRYLPEEYKPAFFASVSYHCHTNSGIFQHINPAELFLWLGQRRPGTRTECLSPGFSLPLCRSGRQFHLRIRH